MAMTDATATAHIQQTGQRPASSPRAGVLAPVVVEDFRFVVRRSDGGWRVEPLS